MYNKTSVYIAACVGMAFFGVAFIVMGSVLPALTAKYGLDSIQASSLVTFLPIGVLLGSLVFGPIVDKFGYRLLLISSIIITLAGLEGLSFINNLNVLRLCILFIGFGGGMLNGSTNSLVSDICNDNDRSAKLSILGAWYGVGALLVPAMLGVLSKYYPYETVLQATGIIMLLSTIYFIAIKFPAPQNEQGLPIKQMFLLAKQPLILILSLFLFFQSGLEGLFNNWTTTYIGKTANIKPEDIVLTLTFFVLGMTVARLLLSKLLGKIKHFDILIGGLAIAILGIIGIYCSADLVISAISLFLCGFGLAAGFPVMIGLIGSIYRETPGTAIGLALFIALSGNSLLNYAMGYISESFGIGSFPLFLIVLLILQTIIIFANMKLINEKS
ncbi:MAG: MFS transporter [Mediterranea sp.]|jgi:fucose permease|nr:MFS transporter [Mediterranea sp.]